MDYENDTSWVRGMLHPGETVLWTGRPSKVPMFERADIGLIPVGIFLVFFGLYFMFHLNRSQQNERGLPIGMIFAGLFIFVALWMVFVRPVLSYRARKKVRFALTSRRLIADNGKTRQTFDLTSLPNMTVSQRSDGSGDIAIGEHTVVYHGKNGSRHSYQEPDLLMPHMADVNQLEYRIRSAVDHALAEQRGY